VTAYGSGRQRLFSLTLRIVSLGQRVVSGMDLAEVARPYVRRLSAVLNETCHVSVPGQEFVVDLVHETGSRLVAVMQPPGTQVPYHCTAIGKALLAHLPEKQKAVLRRPLKRFTGHTIVDAEALRAQLAKVRARGYAVDELEFSMELRCLAAPVFNYDGDAVCAIGMSAPAIRFTEPNVESVAAIVVREAVHMSRELGYNDPRDVDGPLPRGQRSSSAR
jgi:IclR family transcriptional regulator, KDG regulon repressor